MRMFLAVLFICLLVRSVEAKPIVIKDFLRVDTAMVLDGDDLIIEAGTTLEISRLLEYGIHVKNGKLVINGTPDRPVVIKGVLDASSAESNNLIFVEKGRAAISNVRFEDASWGLHFHESVVTVENCIFDKGYGGVRFQGGEVNISRSVFRSNQIAVRFLKSAPEIVRNVFFGNDRAMFIREGVEKAEVYENSFIGNVKDVFLGLFQEKDIKLGRNYFSSTPSVFDRTVDSSIPALVTFGGIMSKFPDWK